MQKGLAFTSLENWVYHVTITEIIERKHGFSEHAENALSDGVKVHSF